jgi:RNA polymerase sigma factor (sigma-70 family)
MRTTLRASFSCSFIHQLERLFRHGTAVGLSEGELLERFVAARDEAAFAALMARHGPMVLGVCRRLLRDANDVDDAFQATFLVLVRKAGSLRRCDLLGNWLYGVAHRVATRSRCLAARRLARVPHGQDALDRLDQDGGEAVAVRDAPSPLESEPSPWLHEEIRRLPEKYRSLVLLCYFEGLTHEQAAARLGWPIGTVKGRLARARDSLRRRLTRRGIDVSDSALASHLALLDALTAVPEPLKRATLAAARAVADAAGASLLTATAVSLPVATLVDGVSRAMITTHVKAVSLVLLVSGAATTGLVIAAAQITPLERDTNPPNSAALKSAGSEKATEQLLAYQPGASDRPPAKPLDVSKIETRPEGSARSNATKKGGQPMAKAAKSGAATGAIEGGAFPDNADYQFRNRLRIAQLSAVVAAAEAESDQPNPKNVALLKELDQPWEMKFAEPTPLQEVLKYIRTTTKRSGRPALPIYVDPKALAEEGLSLASPVVMDLEGVPLKTALRLMLKQLGLAYCVRDGVLIISSLDGIREELTEAASELYSSDVNQLEQVLRSMEKQRDLQ